MRAYLLTAVGGVVIGLAFMFFEFVDSRNHVAGIVLVAAYAAAGIALLRKVTSK